jgi:hypothetical protein
MRHLSSPLRCAVFRHTVATQLNSLPVNSPQQAGFSPEPSTWDEPGIGDPPAASGGGDPGHRVQASRFIARDHDLRTHQEALQAHRGGPDVDGEQIGVAGVSQPREFLANLCSNGMVVAYRRIWTMSLATFATTPVACRVMWPQIMR